MVSKTCPQCQRISYSSTSKGTWICPYCNKDISNIDINRINNGRSKVLVFNKTRAVRDS